MEVIIGCLSILIVLYLNGNLGKMRIEQSLFYIGAEEIQVTFKTLTERGDYIYEVIYSLEGSFIRKQVKYSMLGQVRGL